MSIPPPPPPDDNADPFRPPPPPTPDTPPQASESVPLPPPSSDAPTSPIPGPSSAGKKPVPDPSGPSTGTTEAIPSPSSPRTGSVFRRTPANEETTVLTPVTAPTNILDRIPLSERKRWRLFAGGTAGLAALLLAFTVYLLVINNQWQTRADALTIESYDLGERLTDALGQIVDQQAQIDLLGEQLETSQERVLELADEMAQAGDNATYTQQQLALYQELSALGGSVSLALNHCVNEHEKLVGYLKNPGAWDPESLAAYEAGVNQLCDSAQSANATLQKALTE